MHQHQKAKAPRAIDPRTDHLLWERLLRTLPRSCNPGERQKTLRSESIPLQLIATICKHQLTMEKEPHFRQQLATVIKAAQILK